MDYGGFIAPLVMPGTYTVKLKIGDKEYSNTLQMVHNTENRLFTEKDRLEQHNAGMDIFHMHERLAVLVDKINAEQKVIKESMDSIVGAKSKRWLNDYNTKLETLRSTLLATKHKSIFADEKKLREEITELYGAVCNQECRPTNLQTARIASLNDELKKGEEDFEKLYNENGKKAPDVIKEGKMKQGEHSRGAN